MLMRKSAPHPLSRKTPSGGSMIAKMILQISLIMLVVLLAIPHTKLSLPFCRSSKFASTL